MGCLQHAVMILLCVAAVHLGAQIESPRTLQPTRAIGFLPSDAILSQTRVAQIVQDRQGFIWLGTQFGLNRFDGTHVRQFVHDPQDPNSIGGSYIHALFQDRDGNLWVSANLAFDRYDPRTERFIHYKLHPTLAPNAQNSVGDISQDLDGSLWLSMASGLMHFNPATNELHTFAHDPQKPSSLGNNDIKSTGTDRAGNLWIATRSSLDLWDRQTSKVVRHIDTEDSAAATTFHEDHNGTFWVISKGRIQVLDPTRSAMTNVTELGGVPTSGFGHLEGMLEDSDGDMWFDTERMGAVRLDHRTRQIEVFAPVPGRRDRLTSNRVTALFEDSRGDIWVGLHDAVPNILKKQQTPFTGFSYDPGSADGLHSPLVTTLFEQAPGALLIGSSGTLQLLDESRGTYTTPYPFLKDLDVLAVLPDTHGSLWFGTTRGLFRFNPRTSALKRFGRIDQGDQPLTSYHVQRLLLDHRGRLWAATWGGFDLYDPLTDTFRNFRTGLDNENFYTMTEAPDGAIWLGGSQGIHRVDPDTFKFTSYPYHEDTPGGLSDPRINALHFDQQGRLWVGTQNGLDLLDPVTRTFKVFGLAQGLGGPVVSCIQEDQRHSLWLGTNQGVWRLDPATLRFTGYTTADGLPGLDMTGWGACSQSPDGRIYFGGFSGATSFMPNSVFTSEYVPPVALTGLSIHGLPSEIMPRSSATSSTGGSDVHLAASENTFSLQFGLLDFHDARSGRMRYRLDGIDRDWISLTGGASSANYSKLPPGTYTLHVQGSTRGGPWSVPGLVLTIHVDSPWWRTWKFYIVCFVLALVLLRCLYEYRIHQITSILRIRIEERVIERTRVAREVHDTLLQGMQGLILQVESAALRMSDADPHRGVLQGVSMRAESSLVEARDAVYDMRNTPLSIDDLPDAFAGYAEGVSPLSSAAFFVTHNFLASGSSYDADMLLKLGKEPIRNAFQHASATIISVSLSCDAKAFVITVEDDGIGIPSRVIAGNNVPGHWGIPGMRERLKTLGGSLHLTLREPKGSVVRITVPPLVQASAVYLASRLLRRIRGFFTGIRSPQQD